jgi:hypothetical protein
MVATYISHLLSSWTHTDGFYELEKMFVSMVTMKLYSVIMAPVLFLGGEKGGRNLLGPGPMHITAKLTVFPSSPS